MQLVLGELYQFNPPVYAAGTVKSWIADDFVIRNIKFNEGEYIGEDSFACNFRVRIGNSLYYFKVNKQHPCRQIVQPKPLLSL